MASSQAPARKEEAAIHALIKQAKEANPQDEMVFGGWLNNKSSSQKPMYLHSEKIWSGNFTTKYPDVLSDKASFVETETYENGIKTAVVYSLKTSELPMNHYGFLLAWSDSYEEGKNTRKVYGYCGLLEKFHNIDWNKVEKDLDASSSSVFYVDALTRTSVKADIQANVLYADFM